MSRCRSCNAEIVWGITRNGKRVPLDVPERRYVRTALDEHTYGGPGDPMVVMQDTWISHFATCPNADSHRRKT